MVWNISICCHSICHVQHSLQSNRLLLVFCHSIKIKIKNYLSWDYFIWFLRKDCNTSTLVEKFLKFAWRLNSNPFVFFKVKNIHVLLNLTIFSRTTKYKHWILKCNCCVLFPYSNISTIGFNYWSKVCSRVQFNDLICTFTNFTILVVLETAPKNPKRIFERNNSVHLSTLYF